MRDVHPSDSLPGRVDPRASGYRLRYPQLRNQRPPINDFCRSSLHVEAVRSILLPKHPAVDRGLTLRGPIVNPRGKGKSILDIVFTSQAPILREGPAPAPTPSDRAPPPSHSPGRPAPAHIGQSTNL